MTIHSPGVAADAIAGPADSAAMGPALSRAAAVVAERAPTTRGPGSFRVAFVDALWNLTADEVDNLGRVSSREVVFS